MFKFSKNQTQRRNAALAIITSTLMLILLAGCVDPRFKQLWPDQNHKQGNKDGSGAIAGSMRDYCRKTGKC